MPRQCQPDGSTGCRSWSSVRPSRMPRTWWRCSSRNRLSSSVSGSMAARYSLPLSQGPELLAGEALEDLPADGEGGGGGRGRSVEHVQHRAGTVTLAGEQEVV